MITVLSKVKSHVELYEDDEKVQMYKQVLLEDLKHRTTKKKGKVKRESATSTMAVVGTTASAEADDQLQGQAQKNSEQLRQEALEKQK